MLRPHIIYLYLVIVFVGCTAKSTSPNSTDNDNCKNCGMQSLPYPKWNVVWKNKTQQQWFCSPRCMFAQVVQHQGVVSSTDTLLVTDYYTQERLDARQAFFVIGSDITSPMGHDFVPLKDQQAAIDFQKEHQGKGIIRFGEVTKQTIGSLGN